MNLGQLKRFLNELPPDLDQLPVTIVYDGGHGRMPLGDAEVKYGWNEDCSNNDRPRAVLLKEPGL